ncbi:uncharacterized protein LOC127429192 [Myxocyprinus asiaticus]|uniref:uncharacterized protein LOC127429192 n=1 Tax=Myxocyprinus asiaticus TaxID=70543 RepID=UPI00222167EB|nr:uncharacterized protein LOC127429192 [Myxocyprinus asiaticus]
MDASRHILPRRGSRSRTPSTHRQGRPPAVTAPASPQPAPSAWPRRGAHRRKQTPPVSRPPRTRERLQSALETGDPGTTKPAALELVSRSSSFCYLLHLIALHAQVAAVLKSSAKVVSLFPGSRIRCVRLASRPPSTTPFGRLVLQRWSPALSTQLWHKSAPDVTVSTGHEDRPLPPPSQAVPGVVTRSQVSASMSSDSARPRRGVAPRAPPRREAPPARTSDDIVPLVPLARNLDARLAPSSRSRGLVRTVRLGCAIHFAGHPPRFSSVHFTLVKDESAATLRGDRYPPMEGRDRTCPSSRDEERVLQPLLHCTKKRRWVAANLGPASTEPGFTQTPVQDADAKTHSSERPASRLVRGGRPKDAYFHVSILPRHRPFLRFAFEGQAYQYKSSLSACPCLLASLRRSQRLPLPR